MLKLHKQNTIGLLIIFFVITIIIGCSKNSINIIPNHDETSDAIIFQDDCNKFEKQIKNYILEKLNYCKTDSDCQTANKGFECPFGCNQLINKNADLTKIKKLMKNYYIHCSQCMYKCATLKPNNIKCINNKCSDIASDIFCATANDCKLFEGPYIVGCHNKKNINSNDKYVNIAKDSEHFIDGTYCICINNICALSIGK